MTDFLSHIRNVVTFDARSVHYNKRSFDGMFEIVARADVEGIWREVVLDIQSTRTKALDAVRFLRGHDDAA